MGTRAPRYTIILAAGEGTRMGSTTHHKVCCPIGGQPAVNRAIKIYNKCGIEQHILVVGALAGQVIETVGSAFENVIFTYQAQRLGTAHAARQALKVLDGLQSEHDVLVVAGDRIIKPAVIEQLFDLFYRQNLDLAVLAVPSRPASNQGRLVLDDTGGLLGIVEAADIRQRQVYRRLFEMAGQGLSFSTEKLLQMVKSGFAAGAHLPGEAKCETAFGDLWRALGTEKGDLSAADILNLVPREKTRFEFISAAGIKLIKAPDDIQSSRLFNTSVYLIKIPALRYALASLDRDNAQQEEYLCEIVNQLATASENGRPKYAVDYLVVQDPNHVLGFNTPTELFEVEALILSEGKKPALDQMLAPPAFQTIGEWAAAFEALTDGGRRADETLRQELIEVYGNESQVVEGRVRAFRSTLAKAAEVLGSDQKVFIVRSPGRVNAMGRHIDHQGGICNLMAIGYESLMIVSPRQDDCVRLFSVNPEHYPDREFSIGEMVADLPWDDWLSLVNSEKVSRMVHICCGDWAQYIKAAVLRLQKKFHTDPLRGMDLVVSGNIPIAAGLSSSSSLVVAAAEATVTVNGLNTIPTQLVDLCCEGEWFVGTRGGAADHAAIKFGRKGKLVKVTFFDFGVLDIVPFPDDYALVVCDSGVTAQKTGSARDLFNHRICCYGIGFLLIKKYCPQYASVLHHLRDVNLNALNIPLSEIYRILLRLPEGATRDELRALLPDEDLDVFFNQHHPPDDGLYPIRGVILFGLAEMERSKRFADEMKTGRIEELGRLMNISHDGDRIVSIDADGSERPYRAPTSNKYFLSLIEDLESGDPDRVSRAQLQAQPGSYRCSLAEIDRMVHISLQTEGVVGAQLAGAGLGGCMMVLAQRDAVSKLVANLTRHYYLPRAKDPTILVCRPVAGSAVLTRDAC
jgi:N-acetylgalactosamine kinase